MIDGDFIIIPRILFNDKSLTESDRMLLGLIVSLTLKSNYCFASNNYLAKYINKSKRTISYSLSKLKKLNYIKIEYVESNRRIYINYHKIPKKNANDVAEDCTENIASDCNHKINNKNKEYSKFKNKEITPYWMKHPEVCKSVKPTKEEQDEIDNLINDIINN